MAITSFLITMVLLLADYWPVVLILAILGALPNILKKTKR